MIALAPSPVRSRPTIREWWRRGIDRKGQLSDQSRRLYAETLEHLSEYFGADRLLASITRADAAEFVEWLIRTPIKPGKYHAGYPPADATVRSHVKRCKSMFALALDLELVDRNPFQNELSAIAVCDVEFREMTREELERLIVKLRTPAGPRHSEANGQEWGALVALCRLAGLRRGEAPRLAWADINLERGTITVRPQVREGGKRRQTTKQRRRTVPIEPRLREILIELRARQEPGTPLLCANIPTDGHNLFRRLARAIVRAGIPPHPRMFHSMRKSLECEWLAKYPTMSVTKWLGHSGQIAAMHYHRPTDAELAAVTGAGTSPTGPSSAGLAGIGADLNRLAEALSRAPEHVVKAIYALLEIR